jgi:hypothetical protein
MYRASVMLGLALLTAACGAATPAPVGDQQRDQSAVGVVGECRDAAAGETVTCRIARAHCDYRPDVGGEPTFCNDAPFPNHDFTLLVWEHDWSDYDGQCLIVTGFVSRYEGKPQIVAESRSQVSLCN